MLLRLLLIEINLLAGLSLRSLWVTLFGKKGYKLINLENNTFFISRDVLFHESVFPFAIMSSGVSSPILPPPFLLMIVLFPLLIILLLLSPLPQFFPPFLLLFLVYLFLLLQLLILPFLLMNFLPLALLHFPFL